MVLEQLQRHRGGEPAWSHRRASSRPPRWWSHGSSSASGHSTPPRALPRPTGRSAGLSFAAHVAPPGWCRRDDSYASPTWSRRLALLELDPFELFDAWLQAEHDASIILARWRDAEEGAKGDAHAGYLAGLDREAHAAAVLRRRLEMR
jgi:hypothetical protein